MVSQQAQKPRKALLGRKLGMTQIFAEDGRWIPVTALEVGPCLVIQVKTPEKDGYSAVQLGFGERGGSAKWPQQALFERLEASAAPRFVREVPFVAEEDLLGDGGDGGGDAASGEAADEGGEESGGQEASEGAAEGAGGLRPGAWVGVKAFRGIEKVDVRGVTKGRGFAGTIRRYGFNAGDKSHGSKNVREPGSTGMHTDPGRVIKGKKLPGQMGACNRKARNLQVVRIEEAENLLLVRGAVPGPRGGYVVIEESL